MCIENGIKFSTLHDLAILAWDFLIPDVTNSYDLTCGAL
jgi:hypothetical protein